MSDKRDRQVMVRFTEAELAALQASAELHQTPPATLAARIVRDGIMGQRIPPPATPPPPAAPTENVSWVRPGVSAHWPRYDGQTATAWEEWAWAIGALMRENYPDLAKARGGLPAHWIHDRFARDSLLALAQWRMDLDDGVHDDPRMELAWERSFRELCVWIEARSVEIGTGEPPSGQGHPADFARHA